MDQAELKTVGTVIDAFGGAKAMADIFGGWRTRYSNYKSRGYFPKHMHMELWLAAQERGLRIAPELMGMKRDFQQVGAPPEQADQPPVEQIAEPAS